MFLLSRLFRFYFRTFLRRLTFSLGCLRFLLFLLFRLFCFYFRTFLRRLTFSLGCLRFHLFPLVSSFRLFSYLLFVSLPPYWKADDYITDDSSISRSMPFSFSMDSRICLLIRAIVSSFPCRISFNWHKATASSWVKFSVSSLTFTSFFLTSP